MCGRFAMDQKVDDLINEFLAQGGDLSAWRPSWNISPTDKVPIILDSLRDDTVTRRLELARWSLVPSWSKEVASKVPTFNARSETVAEKAMFKSSVASKRALIPATGYYEWHTEGKVKTPYFIRPEQGTLAFAGLYSWWRDPSKASGDDSRWLLSATIMTMDAVPHLAEIHDRNPVMLPAEWWNDWLDPTITGDQAFVNAAVQASIPVADGLNHYEVGPVRGDDRPQLIEPLARPIS